MDFASDALTEESERKLAADLFNYVWTLLALDGRTEDQEAAMIHAAHASRFHWGQVGKPENLARGDWQISRVYSVVGRPEPALHHAQRCLDVVLRQGLCDFDLAFAYEAMARALAIAERTEERDHYLELARAAGEEIAEQEDRGYLLQDLATIPGLAEQVARRSSDAGRHAEGQRRRVEPLL